MKFELRLLNCFLLILPLLGWNLILGSRLTDPRITSDTHSPQWLLIAENISRVAVFVLPLLMPLPRALDGLSALQKAGLIVYVLGTLIYFASWLPLLLAPASAWSNSPIGLLAPRLSPYLSFLGISLLSGNWLYHLIIVIFVVLHTWHGIQNI